MTVHFIGAGPGDPELITIRGRRLIEQSPVCVYAGSLIPSALLAYAPPGARVIDSAPLTLDGIIDALVRADDEGLDVARLHSGDPSLYGATAEQMRCLDERGIAYDVTPGVPAYAAAAALLKTELTLPDVSQTIILTRTARRSSGMPNREDLATLGASGATLAIHLSALNLRYVCEALAPHYGEECPVVVVYRATWPDQKVVRGTLADIRERVLAAGIRRTALILVGPVLSAAEFSDSHLYHPEHFHIARPKKRKRAGVPRNSE